MYDPQVNDYVRWTTELGAVHEGWVYYKGKPHDNAKRIKNGWIPITNYITIEIATKLYPRVVRGGSFMSKSYRLRSSARISSILLDAPSRDIENILGLKKSKIDCIKRNKRI